MKNYKNALILFLIFAILLGGQILFNKYKKEKTSIADPNKQTIKVLNIKKENILDVDVVNGDKIIKFANQNGEFNLVSPSISNLDKGVVKSFELALVNLSAEKEIRDVKNIEDFGIKKGSQKIKISFKDKTSKNLLIGSISPTEDYRYLMVEDSGTIYMILKQTAENLLIDIDKLKSKDIFTSKSEDVTRIKLVKNNTISFDISLDTNDNTWKSELPIKSDCDETEIKSFINASSSIKVKQFIYDENTKNNFNKNNQQTLLEITDKKNKSISLLIDNINTESPETIAKVSTTKDIVNIDRSALEFLSKNFKDIINKNINYTDIEKVKELEFKDSEKSYVFKLDTGKSGNNADDKFYLENSVIDNAKFRELFNSLTALRAIDIDLKEPVFKKPDVEIIYGYAAYPGKIKVELISKDNSLYYVYKNSKYTGLIVNKKDIDALFVKIKSLKND